MLTIILAAIKKFLLGLISLAALIAIIVSVVTGQPLAHAPTAASASITTDEDTPSAPVTPSVTDPDAGETFTFSIATQPANGAAAVVNNQLVYTPALNYNGPDSFTFRATDSTNLSVVGTASVTVLPVNDPPAVENLAITTSEDTLSAPVTPNVIDPDIGDTHTFTILTQPGRGLAAVIGNQLVYAPDANFNGQDNFAFRVTDSDVLTIDGTALVRVYGAIGLSRCTSPSTVNADGTLNLRTLASPCGFYGEVATRTTETGVPVTVKYIAMHPSNGSAPKAAVYLIGGAELDMGITGDAATGAIITSGGNFLVRTAQLFAQAGYLAIAMDRPSDRPTATPADVTQNIDEYRISVDHATDILAVLRQVNTDKLDVFLSGTSRGAISVVAQNPIAAGISISSAVTRGSTVFPGRLFVGDPDVPSLQPGFVQRPAHVLLNTNDLCPVTTPTDSQALFNNLTAAGVNAAIDAVSGGVAVTSPPEQLDVCGALHFHGYLGIEPTAVARTTAWLDGRVAALAGNRRPDAAFATVATAAGVAKQINLSTLTRDLDGDTPS